MSQATIEQRLETLERQVQALMERIQAAPSKKDWKSSVGMFSDHPLMWEVQEEGRKIREAEREQARRDDS
jgi:hypothetical protein